MEHDAKNQAGEQSPEPDVAAYFDGEITDPEVAARFESMIRDDANAREQLHEYEALRTQLRRLPKTEAPPYLRKRIIYTMSVRGRRMNALRMASRFLLGGAMVAAVVIIVATIWRRQDAVSEMDSVYAAMVTDHAKYKPASPDAEFFGESSSDLETWLSARLDFSPKVPHWNWAELKSGRPCSLNNNKVALVRYRCGGEEMSLYIWPANRSSHHQTRAIGSTPGIQATKEGYEIALWTRDELVYGLVAEPGTTNLPDRIEDAL